MNELNNQPDNESGFSYVDVMIGVTILLVGIMAMLSAVTSAIVMTTQSEQQLSAKQIASSTLESIFSARDIDTLGFDMIRNTANGGVFPGGEQAIWPTAGGDGIVGTADDASGPDGVPGSGDDGQAMPGLSRQITITDINDPQRPTPPNPITMRQIQVTIFYASGSARRQETITTFVADYRTRVD